MLFFSGEKNQDLPLTLFIELEIYTICAHAMSSELKENLMRQKVKRKDQSDE